VAIFQLLILPDDWLKVLKVFVFMRPHHLLFVVFSELLLVLDADHLLQFAQLGCAFGYLS